MLKTYTYPELSEILQIKSPLLMLDRLTLDQENPKATALKMVSMNEFVFAGHFPGQPVMPGVLQIAAMTQASRMIFEKHFPGDGKTILASMRKVKFRKPVQPGMAMYITAEFLDSTENGIYEFRVKNTINQEVASTGIICLTRKDNTKLKPLCDHSEPNPTPENFKGEISDPAEIMKYLPHRLPFLLIDQAYNLGHDGTCYGYKNITGNDALMTGSSDGIFPGYLQIEAGAQLGCAHILKLPGNANKLGVFMSVDEAVFYHQIIPGDRLDITASAEFGGRFGIAKAQFKVADKIVTETKFKFAIIDALGK
ncbi:MAG: hypothetical protein WCS73_00765 [Lentisphaeria bacterium]